MSCSGSVCGKPKSFVDLTWSNKDKYTLDNMGVDNNQWCNADPTIYICGHTNTDNVGYIPMHGACSYQNKAGFYKKQYEDSRRSAEFQGKPPGHLRISQTYLGDISPMFAKAAYENVYGPIIPPLSSIVPVSSVLTYPDGRPYHTYYN
jgi:hypothetical protein